MAAEDRRSSLPAQAPYDFRPRTTSQAEGTYSALLATNAELGSDDRNESCKRPCRRPLPKISVRTWTSADLETLADTWPYMFETEREQFERSEAMRAAVWPHERRASIETLKLAQLRMPKNILSAEFPYAFNARGDPYAEYEEALDQCKDTFVYTNPVVVITNRGTRPVLEPEDPACKLEDHDSRSPR